MSQRVNMISSVQFSHSVMSDSLQLHGLQHTCPSPTPRACSNSCPLSWWCHPNISSCPLLPSIFTSIRAFSNESVLCIRWPKYWSFSFNISPSNEYSGLISFRTDWFVLPVQGTLKSLLQHHNSKASFFGAQLSLQSNSTVLLKWEGRDQQAGSQKSQWKWLLIIWRDAQPYPQGRCKRKLHQDAISCFSDCQNTKYLTTFFVHKAVRKAHQRKYKILQPCGRELGDTQKNRYKCPFLGNYPKIKLAKLKTPN